LNRGRSGKNLMGGGGSTLSEEYPLKLRKSSITERNRAAEDFSYVDKEGFKHEDKKKEMESLPRWKFS